MPLKSLVDKLSRNSTTFSQHIIVLHSSQKWILPGVSHRDLGSRGRHGTCYSPIWFHWYGQIGHWTDPFNRHPGETKLFHYEPSRGASPAFQSPPCTSKKRHRSHDVYWLVTPWFHKKGLGWLRSMEQNGKCLESGRVQEHVPMEELQWFLVQGRYLQKR